MKSERAESGDDSVFEQYVRHADILRNWYVAYGIGGILLFLAEDTLLSRLSVEQVFHIGKWFMLGVGTQVLLAFVNKIYNFRLYIRTITTPEGMGLQDRARRAIRVFNVIDLPLDVFTAVCFAKATLLLFVSIRALPK